MHISPFKGYLIDAAKVTFDHQFYNDLRDDFISMYQKGIFRLVSDTPSYFVLEIKKGNNYFTGIITLISIQDYIEGKIKAHEKTIVKKQEIHKKLLASRKALIKPAAVLINKNQKLNDTLIQIKNNTKPVISIPFPNAFTQQRLWVVQDRPTIDKINIHFKKINRAIIADGHHRFATVAQIHRQPSSKNMLTAFFTSDQMQVFSFYRILRPLKNQSSHSILMAIQKKAQSWNQIKSIPEEPSDAFYLIHQKQIYSFTLKKNKNTLWPHLFGDQITKEVFKIKNESTSKRIYFEEITISKKEYAQMVNQYPDDFIFRLPSLNADEVLHTKTLLPPKSTLFIPRIINGLVVYMI